MAERSKEKQRQPPDTLPNPVSSLSARKMEIARLYAGGQTYKEIAHELFIAPTTVRNHVAAIYRKLGLRNKVDLIRLIASTDANLEATEDETSQDASQLKNDTVDAGSYALSEWLRKLSLEQYIESFATNAIDWQVLPTLDDHDLQVLGVERIGHRKRLLRAINELPTTAETTGGEDTESIPSAGQPERRQLTVMHCELADYMALAERFDPEDLAQLIRTYQDSCTQAIALFAGYTAKKMDGAILVYFGWPQASENAAERALRAGLAIIEAIGKLSPRQEVKLQVRVGVATGPVVVGEAGGEGSAKEQGVIGTTPSLAARLQTLAQTNSVVITEATKRLVEGRFELDSLGPQVVEGIRDPLLTFHVRAIRGASRFEAATAGGLSAFIGRQSELKLLLERWSQAKEGEGQVVLLSGEPGIGKSRMLRELHEHVVEEPHTELRYQCSPFGGKTAFLPIIEQIQHSAGFTEEDSVSKKLDKLERLLLLALDDISTAVPLLAVLLSLPCDRYPLLAMTPQRQKLETTAILTAQFEGLAKQQPVLVSIEDIHWIDPSTLEVFDALVERAQTLPILAVISHRPEFESPWRTFGHVTHHSLTRLNRKDGKALSTQVTGGKELPEPVLEQILEHTDGVPLFLEELTKTVLEGGLLSEANGHYILDGLLPPLAIPLTLQDSLMARLDRLASVKEVAQAASCIGREFSTSLLSTVLRRPTLQEELKQLLDAGLIFRRGRGEDETYIFKHALVQDAAQDSLLITKRQELHALIGEALEASPDPKPAILARHFSAAGLAGKAATYFLAAGKRALSVSALPEASSELEMGLQEIPTLSQMPERDRLELDLRTALGASRIAYRGWSHSSVAAAYEPAFDLAERLNDEQALGVILWGLCVHYWTRAEFPPTHVWLTKFEAAADRSNYTELSVVRDMTAGCQYFWEAEYERAYRYTDHIRKTYDVHQHASIAAHTNHDPLTFSLHWAGSLLQWIIGYPDRGLEMVNEAHALARRINHPFNSTFALTAGSECLLMRGDSDHLLRCCDEVQRVVDDAALGDFAQHVLVDNWRGRTYTRMGDFETGYRLTKLATTRWREAEGQICSAMFWGGEAIALGGLGRTQEALALIEAAIAHCRNTGDRYMEPEVLRVKAELMLANDQSTSNAAEQILIEALQIAREHKAKSWELRAATSLARLMRSRDKRSKALDLLAPIFDWFNEGFDTTDLREAQALLEDLS